MKLFTFKLPREVGELYGELITANNGRYGPYLKFKKQIYLDKGDLSPFNIAIDQAKVLIDNKLKADEPIHIYEEKEVQKGKGRFGPYIKWNNIFINVTGEI